ncbi:MAG: iron-containing alcohol dehydrogenase [Desulfobacteraceae bacterium]|nr:iron-containing alcohol dehydrogenase [Desulfobacteraceae bacterium]
MYIPSYYEFCCKVKTVAGHGTLERIPGLLEAMGARNPMIITDKGVSQAGLATIVINAIEDKISIGSVEDDVPPDSDLKVVNHIASIYKKKACDSIIAVGGGSVLDTAKGVNIVVSEDADDLMQFTGAGALKRELKPLIAVPTTAGTGSEVTLVAVIADHDNNRKMLFTSYFLLPDAAIIDPRMTLTLPVHIAAPTAMDAMTHAIEAYICLSKNPLSDAHALEAIEMISNNIMAVMEAPDDGDARLALGTAATLAGIAFSNSMVGMIHTLGHSVGSVCHVPHGTCMSILLPYGLEYNMHKVGDRIAELLFPLAGAKVYATTPRQERAQKCVQYTRDMNQKLYEATNGIHARNLKEITDRDQNPMVPQSKLPEIARTALGDGSIFYNPEALEYDDCLMVLTAAWQGEKLDQSKVRKG